MSTEVNKTAKRGYIAAFNAGDLTIFERLFHPEYVLRTAGMPDVRGPDALKQLVRTSFEAFSDIAIAIDDMVAEGDRVATRWTLRAVHTGPYMGVPATHGTISVSGIVIDRFVDGRILEAWENFDVLGMMQQLGAPDDNGSG